MEVINSSLPATTMEIATELEALALHYPVLRRTPEEQRIVVRQWAEDLADYPLDLIAEACRQWRNSDAERFPTPGQLKKLVEGILTIRRLYAKRGQEFIDMAKPPPPKPPRPPVNEGFAVPLPKLKGMP